MFFVVGIFVGTEFEIGWPLESPAFFHEFEIRQLIGQCFHLGSHYIWKKDEHSSLLTLEHRISRRLETQLHTDTPSHA